MMNLLKVISLGYALLVLYSCGNPVATLPKLLPNDPFASNIAPSEYFSIDNTRDTVVSGRNGTLLVLPAGCFDTDGPSEVRVELAEALTLQEMILSNLTTTSGGKLLETDGMIYVNASVNGVNVGINSHKPVRVEIPTANKKPGMMVYKGIRDENGNMNWIEPRELDKYLITVDINSLDFLPEGFKEAVEKGLPFREYTVNSPGLTDSLYYSLPLDLPAAPAPASRIETENETYYHDPDKGSEHHEIVIGAETHTDLPKHKGINPLSIKAIRSEEYQNTFIATREFERRLQFIFKTCDNSLLELYTLNLDKDLYEVDEMAAEKLGKDHELYNVFKDFEDEKLTHVKDADKYAALLKGYYQLELQRIKQQYDSLRNKYNEVKKAEQEQALELRKNYRRLLGKREKHRMETYGFTMTEMGWINIDIGVETKNWENNTLEMEIENSSDFDQVYTYVIYTSIKSLYRLNTSDNKLFYAGSNSQMLMPKNQTAIAVAIAYKGSNVFASIKQFITVETKLVKHTLSSTDLDSLKQALNVYENYGNENSILTDLGYMAEFYKLEQKRKADLMEYQFFELLRGVAFPCQGPNGALLFNSNCTSCHTICGKVVGPELYAVTEKHSMDWLIRFTHNSQQMIKSGDKAAVKIYNEYNQSVMTSFSHLRDEEIEAIYTYIKNSGCN